MNHPQKSAGLNAKVAVKVLKTMVAAERFECPTPCAQGGFQPWAEVTFFQLLIFQADGAGLLRVVELY